MNFKNSIEKIIDIEIKNVESLNNKTCKNCIYYHEPLNHCDYYYADTKPHYSCNEFLKTQLC